MPGDAMTVRMPVLTGPGDLRAARRLASLEETIQHGLTTFIEVGEALIEIRGSRLYLVQYPTFEDYCRKRWGFNDSRARQLMASAEVARALTDTTVTVGNEAQARELAPVLRAEGPEAVREVWAEVQERTETPTAAVVRDVVKERAQPRVVSAVVIDDDPTPFRVTLQAFERDIRRLRDGYGRYASDERFDRRFGAVLAAIDAALGEVD